MKYLKTEEERLTAELRAINLCLDMDTDAELAARMAKRRTEIEKKLKDAR